MTVQSNYPPIAAGRALTLAPTPAVGRFPARLAFAGGAICLALLTLLHVIKPELDPSWRFVSEYANGTHGWVAVVAFLSLAIGCAGLFVAIRSEVHGKVGYVGLFFLLASVVGLTMGGVFPMDPITLDPADATFNGNMHALASLIGIPSLPIAAVLISVNLGRQPAWLRVRRVLLWSANLTWLSLALMFATLGVLLPLHGGFGPDVVIGWPNRLLMVAYCGWVMTVAWQTAKRAVT